MKYQKNAITRMYESGNITTSGTSPNNSTTNVRINVENTILNLKKLKDEYSKINKRDLDGVLTDFCKAFGFL